MSNRKVRLGKAERALRREQWRLYREARSIAIADNLAQGLGSQAPKKASAFALEMREIKQSINSHPGSLKSKTHKNFRLGYINGVTLKDPTLRKLVALKDGDLYDFDVTLAPAPIPPKKADKSFPRKVEKKPSEEDDFERRSREAREYLAKFSK